jgi:hypothetical protein
MIRTLLSLAAIGGLLILSSPIVFAQGASGNKGTPPANGSPGASGNAPGQTGNPPPGQQYIDSHKTPILTPGASGYSPGHLKPVSP